MSPNTPIYVERLHYLDGGLVTSVSSRLIDQSRGFSSELLNFDLAQVGLPTKRPGTVELFTALTGKEINGLFEYLKTTTKEKWVLVSTTSGEIYYWDGTKWEELVTGLTGDPVWFINFADRVVFSNGSDSLMSWGGANVDSSLGQEYAYMETFFPYSNNDLVFTAVTPGISGNNIQVEFIQPDEDKVTASAALTGAGTEASPYLVSVTLAYKARVPQQYALFLDSPTGGTFTIGNVFEMEELAYNASANDIETTLKKVYGSSMIESVETSEDPGEDFIITFSTNMINAYLRATYVGLTWGSGSPNPTLEVVQDFEWDEILSTANEIKTLLNTHVQISALITTTHLGDSDGTNTVVTLAKRSLTGGYDSVTGKYLTMFKNRILMVTEEDKLIASHTGDPTLWSPYKSGSNAFEAYIGTNDGTELTGLLDLGDGGLLISKTDTLYGMFGYTRENFVTDLIDPVIGSVGHKTMRFIKPFALFLAKDGIYRYEIGNIPERISYPIQEVFDNFVDHDNIENSSSCVLNRTYIITLPGKDDTFLTLVYYPELDKWVQWTNPSGFVYAKYLNNTSPVMFIPEDTTKIHAVDTTLSTDVGEDIYTSYTSIELDANFPETLKYFGEVYIVFRNTDEPYIITVEISLNGKQFYHIAKNEEIGGTKDRQFVLRVPIGKEARFMVIKISNEDSNRHFVPMAMYYTYQLLEVL